MFGFNYEVIIQSWRILKYCSAQNCWGLQHTSWTPSRPHTSLTPYTAYTSSHQHKNFVYHCSSTLRNHHSSCKLLPLKGSHLCRLALSPCLHHLHSLRLTSLRRNSSTSNLSTIPPTLQSLWCVTLGSGEHVIVPMNRPNMQYHSFQTRPCRHQTMWWLPASQRLLQAPAVYTTQIQRNKHQRLCIAISIIPLSYYLKRIIFHEVCCQRFHATTLLYIYEISYVCPGMGIFLLQKAPLSTCPNPSHEDSLTLTQDPSSMQLSFALVAQLDYHNFSSYCFHTQPYK